MAKSASRLVRDLHQQNIIKLFDKVDQSHSRWQTWADFVVMAAIAISNTVDKAHAEEREKQYLAIAGKYRPKDLQFFAEILAEVVAGMEQNPDQDFLGEMYMALELGNDHAGQFFTPYNVCRMMAKMTYGDVLTAQIERDGWISVNDPACGAGALLVAFANECLERKINYQTSVLFVAQDVDFIVGCMCYLQLSILGCPGYVTIDNTLTHPQTSHDGRGLIPVDSGNVWYTPFYFRAEWQMRRLVESMRRFLPGTQAPKLEATPAELPAAEQEPPQEQMPEPQAPPIIELNVNDAGQYSLFEV
ncbi:MAG: SAM-dependent DNA methyltransferase [Clostridia bacterium]|nr:SAM-dependent DNA methyltransferase [Clostridia bacterium]